MVPQTRREFIQNGTALLFGSAGLLSFTAEKKTPLLAFSTLGCPDWTFNRIVDFAVRQQYQGIELRGLMRELDLTKCKEFSKANIAATRRLMEDNNLRFVDLGSSCTLHFSDGPERKKNLEEGKRFIDLANELKCPNVRMFPNLFPKEREKSATLDLISRGLLELGSYSKGSHVHVLVESHGDLLFIEDLETVMKAAEHKNVGMVWDVTNMWVKTKEPPTLVYEKLEKYILHAHIKDAKVVDEKIQYVRLGKGEVPIFDAIDVLYKGGYEGYYSFEWEKLWHPELEEPELVIEDYARVMTEHFKK